MLSALTYIIDVSSNEIQLKFRQSIIRKNIYNIYLHICIKMQLFFRNLFKQFFIIIFQNFVQKYVFQKISCIKKMCIRVTMIYQFCVCVRVNIYTLNTFKCTHTYIIQYRWVACNQNSCWSRRPRQFNAVVSVTFTKCELSHKLTDTQHACWRVFYTIILFNLCFH